MRISVLKKMVNKYFEGGPCINCGRTLRYKTRGHCVNCHSLRYAGTPQVLNDRDKELLLELRHRHGLRLRDLAEKFEISLYWVKRNLQGDNNETIQR